MIGWEIAAINFDYSYCRSAEVTPGSVIFCFLGLVVAVGSHRALTGRTCEQVA